MPTVTKKDDANSSASPQAGVKKVRKTEEYLEPITTQVTRQSQPQQDIDSESEVITDDEERFFNFLDDLDRTLGYKIIVNRLPHFNANGKWGKGALTAYCGDLQVGLDDLVSQEYLSQIQGLWGAGAYRIELRNQMGHFVKRWPIQVDAPAFSNAMNQTQASVPLAYQQKDTDSLSTFIDTVKKLSEVQELLGYVKPQQTTAPAAPAAPAPAAPMPADSDNLAYMIIKHAIEKGDGTVLDRAMDKYLGPSKPETGIADIVYKLAEPMLPGLTVALGNLLNAIATRFTTGTPEQAAPLTQTQAPATTIQSNVQQTTEQKTLKANLTPELLAWLKVAGRIREDILDAASVNASVSSFEDFAERYPEELGKAHVQLFLAGVAADVLEVLQLELNTMSLQWIVDWRNALVENESMPETTTGAVATGAVATKEVQSDSGS